jgi:hypothetical protein
MRFSVPSAARGWAAQQGRGSKFLPWRQASQQFLWVLILQTAAWFSPGAGAQQVPAPALQPEQIRYLGHLQRDAMTQGLADDPTWHKLVHYQRHPVLGYLRSLADDAGFFASPVGKHNPAEELAATLAAFFDDRATHELAQSAQCRFAARYAWLRERLQIDEGRLPPQPCTRLNQWLTGLDAARVSLVFPAAFLNSPGSMYGHTFLRLDQRGAASGQPLLSYAISYAAQGSESEGVMFALKGLFGGYDGALTTTPYYLRIRDYSDLENRDIWEYELNLTDAQIDLLLRHAWELTATRFDYYFFDENCSYLILRLLDVARADLRLADQFAWWAIPVDTVRAVADTPGLVRSKHYRPSNASELRARMLHLPPDAVKVAGALADGSLTPGQLAQEALTAVQQAQVLELSERYVAFLGARGAMSAEQVQRRRVSLLAARADLPPAPAAEPPVPAVAPHEGHRTIRVDAGMGRRDAEPFWQIGWRSSYHELTEAEAGYTRGAQIEIGRVEVAQLRGDRVRLDRLTFVDIISLSPKEGLLGGLSWKVRLGLERSAGSRNDGRAPLALGANGGPGYAMELVPGHRALAYGFMDNQLWYDPALGSSRWALGTGIQLGLLWDPLPWWRLHLQGYRRVSGGGPDESGWAVHQRFILDAEHNLLLKCDYQQRNEVKGQTTCGAGIQRYW